MSVLNRKFWEKLYQKIPGFIKNDPARKLLALALTLLIFAYYHSNKTHHMVKVENIPVRISIPEGHYLLTGTQNVTVILRCSSIASKNIQENDVKIHVPLSVTPGQKKYEIKLKNHVRTSAFFGVSVADVQPQTVTVSIDRRVSKTVNVDADIAQKGKLPEGYAVVKASVQPETVTLSGPEELLKDITKLGTKEIPLDHTVTRSFIYTAKVALPEKSQLEVSPEQVQVSVDVDKSHEKKTFSKCPVKLLMNSSVDTRTGVDIISAKTVEITVSGLKSTIETLTEKDIVPYADISRITENGRYNNIPVKCWAQQEGLTILSVVPDSINVRIGPNVEK